MRAMISAHLPSSNSSIGLIPSLTEYKHVLLERYTEGSNSSIGLIPSLTPIQRVHECLVQLFQFLNRTYPLSDRSEDSVMQGAIMFQFLNRTYPLSDTS